MRVSRTGAVVLAVALGAPLIAKAQDQDRGRWSGVARLDPGTTITVRTNEPIDSSRTDYRVYTATVDRGVRGDNGDLAIPRGATRATIRAARRARSRAPTRRHRLRHSTTATLSSPGASQAAEHRRLAPAFRTRRRDRKSVV